MQTPSHENFRNLPVLYQPPMPGSPEEELERELQTWAARVKGKNGKVPSRAFYDLADGDVRPFRVIMRRVNEADAARVPPDQLLELQGIFARYLEAKIVRRTGARRQSVA